MDAKICRWFGGKQAALSLRFDDSHPTHVDQAVPILNAYGLKGTFMVNPGRENHQKFKDAWEGSILAQGHELANHTVHHRGAQTDREAEAEIGGCSEYIWGVQTGQRRLLAFARGGGTVWMPRKPVQFFRDKYALFRTGQSMSCSEVYAHFSVDGFRQRLDRAIAQGEWLETHFHCIGDGYLNISIPSFRALLGHAQNAAVWQAGMAACHKYEAEREGALLLTEVVDDDTLALHLTCTTDPTLYDHPLTLAVTLPGQVDVAAARAGGDLAACRIADGTAYFDVPPVDATYRVRAKGLGRAFAEDEAPIETGPHPFLFFRREDLPALRQKATASDALWAWVKQEADVLIGPDAPALPGDDASWQAARASAGRLWALGLAYAVTDETAYAARAVEEIAVVLRALSWTHEAVTGDADLVSAEIACGLGLAYDWLHDALDADLKAQMREAIATRGLAPIAKATADGVWWTRWYRCNWGAVIYGQAGVAALCLLGEEPRAADWVRLCRSKIWGYGRALGEDGSWGESVSYGCYAWFNATLLMDALHHVTNGVVDLFDNARLRRFPEWFAHLLVPDASGFVPFSNCGAGTGFRGQFLYRLARAFGDGHAQWLAEHMSGGGSARVFGFLWHDSAVAAKSPADLPTARVFEGVDWAVLRSGWEHPDAVLFALKGGQKDWDHFHHDTNHFVLYAYGRPLVVDLFYPHQLWGCQTEAHNTVMVNGRDQRGPVRVQGMRGRPDHRGTVTELIEAPWYARMIGDASLAYEPEDVNSFVREVLSLRHSEAGDPPDYFVLFDDVDATRPVPMDWLLHTYGTLSVTGSCATMVQDRAAVDVVFAEPENVAISVHQKGIAADAGAPLPFDGADQVTFLKAHAEGARVPFVTVLLPRRAAEKMKAQVSAIRGANLAGVQVAHGEVTDRALFALDAPAIAAAGLVAAGRTCLVRQNGDRVVGAALHNGQRLEVDGRLLLETNGFGHAVLRFEETGVDAQLTLSGAEIVRLFAPGRPARVTADGEDLAFEYEADVGCVRFRGGRGSMRVRVDV